jgi:hypothetical protein
VEITRFAKPAREHGQCYLLWHCAGCGVVHMSVGKMVRNFTRDEFANLTEAVVDINYSGWATVSGEHSVLDMANSLRRTKTVSRLSTKAGSGLRQLVVP